MRTGSTQPPLPFHIPLEESHRLPQPPLGPLRPDRAEGCSARALAAGVIPWLLLQPVHVPPLQAGMEGMPFVGWLMMALVGLALLALIATLIALTVMGPSQEHHEDPSTTCAYTSSAADGSG